MVRVNHIPRDDGNNRDRASGGAGYAEQGNILKTRCRKPYGKAELELRQKSERRYSNSNAVLAREGVSAALIATTVRSENRR